MLNSMISIIGIIFTLLLIIGIHELGHFLAARLLGIKVLRFSIGFGKALWKRRTKIGTEFVIAAIPLGGYVKLLDSSESPVAEAEAHLAFNHQPFYKKALVVMAGPIANMVLAFVLYWILFVSGFTSIAPITGKIVPQSIAAQAGIQANEEIISIDNIPVSSWMSVIIRILSHSGDKGFLPITLKSMSNGSVKTFQLDLANWHMDHLKPDPLLSLGLQPYEPNIPMTIGDIMPNSPAAKAGLKKGDKILTLNGKKINDWMTFVIDIDQHPTENITLEIQRQHHPLTIIVKTDYHRDMLFKKHGFLGLSPQFEWPKTFLRENRYSPIAALSHAWQNTKDFILLNVNMIGKLLTGKVSLQSLSGPISIFQTAGTALHQGIAPFLSFLAFLSISIGIINIVPIPGLDGGHLLFQLAEVIIRRPVPARVVELCYRMGFIFLFLLIFQSVINDVLRLQ